MMSEINSYSACVQLVNHPAAFGDTTEKRGESAASASVDPQIPTAGVAERSGPLDCVQGLCGFT